MAASLARALASEKLASDKSGSTEAERRLAHEQALASARIEGFIPEQDFLADCEEVIAGTITHDEARARSLARALAKDAVIATKK